jgi:hypothetical protein
MKGNIMSENHAKGADEKFCESCGSVIKKQAELCPQCGVRQKLEGKNWTATLLFCLLGIIMLNGVQRFYTGNWIIGLIQLLTLGGLGIWQLIDLILIIAGAYRDARGRLLVK